MKQLGTALAVIVLSALGTSRAPAAPPTGDIISLNPSFHMRDRRDPKGLERARAERKARIQMLRRQLGLPAHKATQRTPAAAPVPAGSKVKTAPSERKQHTKTQTQKRTR